MIQKIAMLISGRISCWEVRLLNVLRNSDDYDIDLFISINLEYNKNKYFEKLELLLGPYIKYKYINIYNVPDDFINTSTKMYNAKQLINGKLVPRNILSMWWNYKNAFDNAVIYQNTQNITYDFFMTFRSDIIIDKLPIFTVDNPDVLYSVNQPCHFPNKGIHDVPIVSPEWCFGKEHVMCLYMETYNFILHKSKEDNDYICHYESNVTDNCFEKNLTVVRIPNINYDVDPNRRIFDDWENIHDTRVHNIHNRTQEYVNINEYEI
jgi:hypothetical protein